MRRCSRCKRFLSDSADTCRYCGSTGTSPFTPPLACDEELVNYKIYADEIQVKGESYRIIEAVGQGGHGMVLKVAPSGNKDGSSSKKNKYFAIKVPLEFNEHFSNAQGNKKSLLNLSRRYISHEVDMLNKIKSSALLEIVYAGPAVCRRDSVESQFPAILMELAETTLKDLMDAEMANSLTLTFDEKLDIIRQLTAHVEELHREIVVHRDISPHNIFVVDRDGEIKYVLGDFGTSKPANIYDIDNSTTRMAFHDRYLDPALFMYERFRYDRRIDIYQMGVLITEILLGEYWQTDDEDTSATGLMGIDFENDFLLKFAVNQLPQRVIEKIRKAVTLNINQRYRTASHFKEAMHDALELLQKQDNVRNPRDPGEFKKNIAISYRRIVGEASQTGTSIDYCGQKKIDIGAADLFRLTFPGIRLKRARIIGSSFLECNLTDNIVTLRVNTDDIHRCVKPLLKPGLTGTLKRLIPFFPHHRHHSSSSTPRIEFECKSVLYIEGRYTPKTAGGLIDEAKN
jgi:serine/threonine protein kinase